MSIPNVPTAARTATSAIAGRAPPDETTSTSAVPRPRGDSASQPLATEAATTEGSETVSVTSAGLRRSSGSASDMPFPSSRISALGSNRASGSRQGNGPAPFSRSHARNPGSAGGHSCRLPSVSKYSRAARLRSSGGIVPERSFRPSRSTVSRVRLPNSGGTTLAFLKPYVSTCYIYYRHRPITYDMQK